MKAFLDSVKDSIGNRNWYAALTVSLTLPDIASKIQYPDINNISKRYSAWFHSYLGSIYSDLLVGEDCYALRCALLHEGGGVISKQRAKKILNEIHFAAFDDGNSVDKIKINNVLQLDVKKFCEEVIDGVEQWLSDIASDKVKTSKIDDFLYIHIDYGTSPAAKFIGIGSRPKTS